MARSEINTEFNTFVGGILTEANPINYPVGYTLDEENFILERNGTRVKRHGLDAPTTPDTGLYYRSNLKYKATKYFWEQAGTAGTGTSLKKDLLLMSDSNGSIRAYKVTDADDVFGEYIGTISAVAADKMLAIGGYLVIVGSRSLPMDINATGSTVTENITGPAVAVVSFDAFAETFTVESVNRLMVRDFVGQPQVDDLKTRPSSLDADRYYNLINSGWTTSQLSSFKTSSTGSKYPAPVDNVNLGIDPVDNTFTTSWLESANTGSTTPINGSLLVDVCNPQAWRASIDVVSGFPNPNYDYSDTQDSYIRGLAEFAGRVFYLVDNQSQSEFNGIDFGSAVLAFSQSVGKTADKFNKCYSINDPTSSRFNAPLDTDGGYLDVSAIGKPIDIVALKNSVLLFGTNGVFEVLSNETVITPKSLYMRKVTDVPAMYAPVQYLDITGGTATIKDRFVSESVVVANESVYYLSENSVKRLFIQENTNRFISQDVGANIRTLVRNLGPKTLSLAEGIYLPDDNTIRWLMPLKDDNVDGRDKHLELVYDLSLNAWYKNTFNNQDSSTINIYTFFKLPNNLITYTDNSRVSPTLRYIGFGATDSGSNGNVCLKYVENTFEDFKNIFENNPYSSETFAYTAFLQTGYLNANDSSRQKQSSYIVPSFLRTENGFVDDGSGNLTPTNESSCLISAWWDYVDDASLPKANDTFEAYKYNRLYIPSGPADTFDYGQTVITTKNRLTGRGRALSLRFESPAYKDCKLLGWNLAFGSTTKV